MSELTVAQIAVMLHAAPHLGPKGIACLLKELPPTLPGEKLSLDEVRAWRLSSDSLQREYKLHPKAANCIAVRKEQLVKAGREIFDSSQALGIRVLTILDPDYPSMLRAYEKDPPPILYAYGNLDLLRERKFAIVSSANISSRNTEVLREFAGLLCDGGLAAVTSHNTHPYQVTGLAARSRKAPVVLVLDRGILCAFPRGLGWEPVAQARIWNLRFDASRDLVLSRFRLYDRWIGENARLRDRMVFSLADVVVAVEIRPGGVMESECLRAHSRGREVYIYSPSGGEMPEGNKALLEKGCPPITRESARSVLTTLDLPMPVDEPE